MLKKFRIPPHAGAGVDDVNAGQHGVVVSAQAELGAARQLCDRVSEVRLSLEVRDDHVLAFERQMVGDRDAAARRPHHQCRHEERRATPNAARAPTSPAPQKESAMRFSDQPSWWNV